MRKTYSYGGGVQVGNSGYKESPSLREPREPEMGGCVHWKLKTLEVPADTRMGLWFPSQLIAEEGLESRRFLPRPHGRTCSCGQETERKL